MSTQAPQAAPHLPSSTHSRHRRLATLVLDFFYGSVGRPGPSCVSASAVKRTVGSGSNVGSGFRRSDRLRSRSAFFFAASSRGPNRIVLCVMRCKCGRRDVCPAREDSRDRSSSIAIVCTEREQKRIRKKRSYKSLIFCHVLLAASDAY